LPLRVGGDENRSRPEVRMTLEAPVPSAPPDPSPSLIDAPTLTTAAVAAATVAAVAAAAPTLADMDYVRGMERLLQAVQELSLARTLPEIQRIVRTSARELTGCDGATFVLRDNGMCYYADEDAIAPLWKGNRFPMEICISGWSMLHREAAVIPDIYQDNRIPHAAYRPTFVKSLVMVPIRRLDPVGAIGNYWADEHRPTAQEISLLQALADSTSIAMENVRVYAELEQRVSDRTADLEAANDEIRKLLVTDELTGLNNRRGFYLLANPALRAAQRDGRRCVLAFLDVDGLKRVNDGHGHEIGDSLISDVADVVRGALLDSDIIARMGGDEFAVLVTDPTQDATALRDRLSDAFRAFNDTAGRPYRLSASIGLAEAAASGTDTIDELLAAADGRMYDEKKTRPGRRLNTSTSPR
jgi:diguanylate cyclase (GGDEF)-like protein